MTQNISLNHVFFTLLVFPYITRLFSTNWFLCNNHVFEFTPLSKQWKRVFPTQPSLSWASVCSVTLLGIILIKVLNGTEYTLRMLMMEGHCFMSAQWIKHFPECSYISVHGIIVLSNHVIHTWLTLEIHYLQCKKIIWIFPKLGHFLELMLKIRIFFLIYRYN